MTTALRSCALLLLTVGVLGACQPSSPPAGENSATAVDSAAADRAAVVAQADRFYAHVDANTVPEYWPELSPWITSQVSLEDFEFGTQSLWRYLGDLQERQLISAERSGDQYFVRYQTRYEHGSAIEQVSLRLEEGVWRIDSTANSNINRD